MWYCCCSAFCGWWCCWYWCAGNIAAVCAAELDGIFGSVVFMHWLLLYCGLRGMAPKQWLPQLSCFRWLCSVRLLLLLDREDIPDVPDVPELIVEHDASELFERFDADEIPARKPVNHWKVRLENTNKHTFSIYSMEFVLTGHIRWSGAHRIKASWLCNTNTADIFTRAGALRIWEWIYILYFNWKFRHLINPSINGQFPIYFSHRRPQLFI